MGTIIIKVPENIERKFTVDNMDIIKEFLEKLERKEKIEFLKKNLDKVLGKVEVEDVTEEEVYLQGD